MPYCTKTDLETIAGVQLVQDLTDDERSGSGNPSIATRVTRAIVDADAVIDGHLRAHYSVPLASPVPALARRLSEDLALFNLFSRRASGLEMPAYVVQKQADAMKMLGALRDGKMDLGVDPPPAASTAEVAAYDGADALFTDDTMDGF